MMMDGEGAVLHNGVKYNKGRDLCQEILIKMKGDDQNYRTEGEAML